MKQRLEAILRHEKITPSKLADLIAVQRSGISHIMSGRNKPGLDFLAKLLRQFPHINGDWLVTGEGPMLKNAKETEPAPRGSGQMALSLETSEEKPRVRIKTPLKEEDPPPYQSAPKPEEVTATMTGEKTIDRIIVFYTDRSFREYRPD